MAMIRLSALACVVGLLGAAMLPACGSDVPQEQARAGTLELALTGVSNTGVLYRLRQGTFSIAGPTSAELSTETDPDASSLQAQLSAGDYLITLANGWTLEKEVGGAFVTVDATLESENPAMFSITSETQTGVVFQFRAGDEQVELGDGTLDVDIAVDDLTCPPGTTDCGGICVDTSSDPANCGACANACSVQSGTASCSNGMCTVGVCDPGRANCDASSNNGCETSTSSDLNNCGACGLICPSNGGNPSCLGGVCNIACHPGFSDCNGSPGCETPTQTDPLNCGGCGLICMPPNGAPLCNASVCGVAACNVGWANCDGQGMNGCERLLNLEPACSAPTSISAMAGDSSGSQSFSDFGEKRFKMRLNEGDLGATAKDLSVRFSLTSPAQTSYSIEASCDDGCTVQTSASGNPATVTLRWSDASPVSNDSGRDVFVNIVYQGGSSPNPDACATWTLQVSSGVNGGQATCTSK